MTSAHQKQSDASALEKPRTARGTRNSESASLAAEEAFENPEFARARNMAWTAANDFSYVPRKLVFEPDETPSLYANTASGLIHKWFDRPYSSLTQSWQNDYRAQDLDRLAWFAFESAVFPLELASRPVLAQLRPEFFSNLDAKTRALATDLDCAGLSPAEIAQKVRACAWMLYGYNGRNASIPKPTLHLGVSLLSQASRLFHDRKRENLVIRDGRGSLSGASAGEAGRGALARLLQKQHEQRAAEDRAYIRACFGNLSISEKALAVLELSTCAGIHEGCHLWICRAGEPAGVEGAGREFKSMKASAQAQIKRNHAHYAANRSLYREASLRLAELLGDRLRPSNSRTMRGQKQGAIDAGRIWRFDKLEDPHVFKKPIELDEPDLAICMLLDASGSRTDDQPEIAAQAQVIATALERCGIPHMLYAFSSVRGYTVLREFGGSASAGPGESDSLLNCYAAGLNRDGLALRAAGELFSRSTATTRLLIVLTDGAPMDSETNATKPYNGKDAIDDTAQEVRALRARGINVAAIYNGEDDFFASARLIYGSELVRVSSPYLLAQTVARLIINTAHL